ncbi:putative membrane-anchored protein [Lachnospiraceae bacterium PF1-22]
MNSQKVDFHLCLSKEKSDEAYLIRLLANMPRRRKSEILARIICEYKDRAEEIVVESKEGKKRNRKKIAQTTEVPVIDNSEPVQTPKQESSKNEVATNVVEPDNKEVKDSFDDETEVVDDTGIEDKENSFLDALSIFER